MVPSSPDLEKAFPRLHVKESLDEEHADHDDHDHDEGHKDLLARAALEKRPQHQLSLKHNRCHVAILMSQ